MKLSLRFWRLASQTPASHKPVRRCNALGPLELLEGRNLPSGLTISGYVFSDANANGLFDANEAPVASNQLQLVNSSNVVIASAVTDAAGFYQFTTDGTINTNPKTQTYSLTFNDAKTNQSQILSLPQFNPSLGTLTGIDISVSGHITSDIKVENLDPSPATITGTVAGTLSVSALDFNLLITTSSTNQTFNASAFDGTLDYAGTSGKDFGSVTVPGSNAASLSSAQALADYTGTGSVVVTEGAQASSTASGGGNLSASISSLGGSTVTVTYHYIPSNSLRPGNYTIVQVSDPAGFLDGKESQNGVVLANSIGTDSIPVTLQSASSPNNDFGEVQPARLSGYVYVDNNNDGIKGSGEAGLGNLAVTLTGTSDVGAVSLQAVTLADGSYSFNGLRPGTYTLTKAQQPVGYADGKTTAGSQGGTAGTDVIGAIVLYPGVNGVNNNFGELLLADLSITKAGNPNQTTTGGTIVYTITVANAGPSTATGVVVQDPLPAGETFVSAQGAGWTIAQSGGTVTATTPSMASGASSTFTITVQAPSFGGTIVNTATVSSATPDPNLGNNTAQATTVINVIAGSSSLPPATLVIPRLPGLLSKQSFLASSKQPYSVYAVTMANGLFGYDSSTGMWTRIGGDGTILSVQAVAEPAGNIELFVITTNNALYRFDAATGWVPLGAPHTILTESAGTDRTGRADVFVIGADNAFYEFSNAAGWQSVGAANTVLAMSAADNERVVVITSDRSVAEHDPVSGWIRLSPAGFAQSISTVVEVLDQLVVYAVGPNQALYRCSSPGAWAMIGGPGSIQAASAGTDVSGQDVVYALTTGNALYRYSATTGWQLVCNPGSVKSFVGSDFDRVFIVTADNSLFKFDDSGWARLSGAGFAH